MLKIDGSTMEGGGQLLRMALTYSAITCKPVNVTNIRASRRNPGLKPQHYNTVKALKQICNAKVKGLKIDSKEIEFHPETIQGGEYSIDIGTAGSISLMLQCLTPVAAFADDKITLKIKGGTAVKWSPPMTFLTNIVWEAFKKMGFKGEIKTIKQGFYPKGGGLVQATIKPITSLKPLTLPEQGKIKKITGTSLTGRLPDHVAKRQASSAKQCLEDSGYKTEIKAVSIKGANAPLSPGSVITLWTQGAPEPYIGSDSLGEKGKPAEKVGKEAADKLVEQIRSGATVDIHTADHLILPCSLARGESIFKTSSTSLHTLTAIKLAEKIVGASFCLEKTSEKLREIRCKGVSQANSYHYG
jgi:RNA 3'-phosphate cyclase